MNSADNPDDEHSSEPGRPRPRASTLEHATTTAPDSNQSASANTSHPRSGDYWVACFVSWLGILAAGGIYGILLETTIGGNEPIFSFFAGIIVAGIFSAPVGITIAVPAWCFWLSRFQATLAMLVGACTGVVTSAMVGAGRSHDAISMIILAGCLGGGGGGLAALIYWNATGRTLTYVSKYDVPGWRFSLRDLFWRFTVLAVLIAAWSLFFGWVFRH